ncbi:MAG: VOC family protein [Hormoscilla sp. GM7CHS1pb]|nr:VOC family protein [Hormoscilla sp. GM7CHS1pb]
MDMEKILAFYAQRLGRQPDVNIEQVYAEFHLPGLRLGILWLAPRCAISRKTPHDKRKSSGSMSLCLEVDDLERAIAHLRTLGYQPPGEISTASHGREIYAYDPQGNRLILHQSWDMG